MSGRPASSSPATRLTGLGVVESAAAIRRGEIRAIDLVEACLARIAATDDQVQAWVTVDAAGARAAARAIDAGLAAGSASGPLAGVPIGMKDIIDVAGSPTTAGAPAFAHTHPSADAVLVARLRAAGAVILGKTVATQFAYKDPAATRNPWSAAHTPGGSSSGSAAAVAARQVPAGIGTQTVGSILRPAAFCGVVGLKGAFGRVPMVGVLPLAPSFDHAGPIARSVADAVLLERVLAGAAETVGTSEPSDPPRLGVSRALLDRAETDLRRRLDAFIAVAQAAGATIVALDLPPIDGLVESGRLILEVEAAASHESWFAVHHGEYAPGIAALIRVGQTRSAPDYLDAQRIRAEYRSAAEPVLATVDALVSPVAPGTAPLRSEGTGDFSLCAPWSFIGVPSISLPIGLDGDGLPLAVQLTGSPAADARLLGAAGWIERLVAFEERPRSPAVTSLPPFLSDTNPRGT